MLKLAFSVKPSRGRVSCIQCGSGLSFLQTAKTLSRKGVGGCKNPTKPVPLRKLARDSQDYLVEIITKGLPHPSCTLRQQPALTEVMLDLLSLRRICPQTLLLRISHLEEQLATLPAKQKQQLCSHPACAAFLERCLEVVGQRGMGPAAPVLLLRVLSKLRFGDDADLREAYLQYHRTLVTVLEDSVKRDPAAYTPQAVVGCYESWAGMDLCVTPPKSSLAVVKLREWLRSGRLAPQDCLRLLVALSTLRTRTGGQYSPSTYDVSDLVSAVVFGLPAMRASQMAAACAACAGFEWPLYRSPAWALDCVAQEALRRLHTGSLHRTAARKLLEQAVQCAGAIRPRLGKELEARIAEWEVQVLAGAATLSTAQQAASWAEVEEAAATLSSAVVLSLENLGINPPYRQENMLGVGVER